MNARPYIFGCLCLVGGNGTAAASDTSLTETLLSSMSRSVTSSFEGSGSRSSQGGHDGSGGDVTTARQLNTAPQPASNPSPMPTPVDADADARDGSSGGRSPAPNWQSLLPGSIF